MVHHSQKVSNPIREYLQIFIVWSTSDTTQSFKPYKGVSSNSSRCSKEKNLRCVSNPIREYLQIKNLASLDAIETGFKPYKGVSSNVAVHGYIITHNSFKPYKGVSSNRG